MPHQCVRCSTFYEDGATEILKGCKCGGKLFFYIKKDKVEEAKKVSKEIKLSKTEKEQIEKDVFDLVGSEIDRDKPVILDFESIRSKIDKQAMLAFSMRSMRSFAVNPLEATG